MTQSPPIRSFMNGVPTGIAMVAISFAAFTLRPASFGALDGKSPGNDSPSDEYLDELVGSSHEPTIVLFVVSLSCAHCYEQIEVFARKFALTPIVVVAPQMDSEIRQRLPPTRLRFVHDTNGVRAHHFGVAEMHHAIFLFDSQAEMVWHHVAEEPLLETANVSDQLRRLSGMATRHKASGKPKKD